MAIIHKKTIPYDTVANAVPTTGGGGGGGAVTVADGADVAEGATTDAAVDTDAAGTVNAHLRGLVKRIAAAFNLGTPFRVDPTGSTTQPVSIAATVVTSEVPVTTGGLSGYNFLSTAAVISAAIKASAGQVYSMQFFNKNASPMYVRLYNMTTAPATTDTPVWRGIIPGNAGGAGYIVQFPTGFAFGTGIGIRVTAAVADNDATALTANDTIGNVQYK